MVRTNTYDNAGNTLSDGSRTFTHNNAGRTASVSGCAGRANYSYKALASGSAKSTPSGTTVFMYDEAGHLLGEYDRSGNVIQELVWLGRSLVTSRGPVENNIVFS